MAEKYYSSEKSIQILVSLLKQHGIRKIVASPGTTNLSFVGSLMHDKWFEMYSSVDERSAAYMACGMAAESGEPVVITCTGATASRNYLPGLTEAFYRKLPVLAVTATQDESRIGQLIPQVIDRRNIQNDVALLSVHIGVTRDNNDIWSNTLKINNALLELCHHGGGPVHINLTTTYSRDYSVKELPVARKINRYIYTDNLPEIPSGKVAVIIGAHRPFTDDETESIEEFCKKHDAVVFGDHTSNYKGKHFINASLLFSQDKSFLQIAIMDLLIHIGEVSGAYLSVHPLSVWRVSPDGLLKDGYGKLTNLFEMKEIDFFHYYASQGKNGNGNYFIDCKAQVESIIKKIPDDYPFSNIWVAQHTAPNLPQGSILHLGILNTLRSWNFFDIPQTVSCYCNTGGFGIDGGMSSALGASMMNPDKQYFLVIGDLAFFYDLNSIGNRHLGKNFRIMLINNGKGTEFRNYNHPGAAFDEDADKFIAAAGHYGNKSPFLVRHIAEDLGFTYLEANGKDEFLANVGQFISVEPFEHPILFQVFTDSNDESETLKLFRSLNTNIEGSIKNIVRSVFGEKGITLARKVFNH